MTVEDRIWANIWEKAREGVLQQKQDENLYGFSARMADGKHVDPLILLSPKDRSLLPQEPRQLLSR